MLIFLMVIHLTLGDIWTTYWNENMGPDDATNATINSSLWYSSLPQMIARTRFRW